MENNPDSIVRKLQLQPHPEGGYFRELYRSAVNIAYIGRERSALTTIYFLLEKNQASRWHQVDADEVWHFYEGGGLDLYLMKPDFSSVEKISLGEVSSGREPVKTVPAGWWQAAIPQGEFALCGCTVAPAFEFSGFRFLEKEEKKTVAAMEDCPPVLL